jgi:hypothetical protein
MDNIKFKRAVTGQTTATTMTDAHYAKLSKSQQFIAALAEALAIPVLISEYEGRLFVSSATVDQLTAKFS